ncbi:hypothetical protein A3G63_02095 [Candidatus Kaiserbacteria bacterium RIFCSPLOWO2_12_FULL_52_8]|uniref:Vitamin K epoxide reductase domain-containing protein n=1 Tax=Candidatus Kaiserbacteria bacterium RIFCSPHIGHO2_01_FULL_53_31 TaxID=1798481 RepID=A0A1F6CHX5_9BACT|nr:MAG: hypothetical protein A2678_00480 [Candidatus Kaiserbacteria bacterium RIFCSPHIGHO2_01_FULL_53_31]OGG92835.1 MAG: hypothetical protein A3G63_02095 [Candidatus Kaiserbacteria bacterium RIFCSPLOWO2_12_FULL_52_8]
MKRAGVVLILVLAFFGIADSAYLAQHETTGLPLLCNIESLTGCNVVVSSAYSQFLGVPLADLGLIFYTVLFVVAAFEIALFNQSLRRGLQVLAVIGIVTSLYSVYTQVFLINALCIYCLVSASITILVLVLASFIEPLRKNPLQNNLATT